jgi:hypothetical protein
LHAWVDGDVYRPDCIETAGFGHKAEKRLARMLAVNTASRFQEAEIQLSPTHYREKSYPTMAHRHFSNFGICSLLVETSPSWPTTIRRKTYIGCITKILNMLVFPPNKIMSNDLMVIKSKQAEKQPWIDTLHNNSHNTNKTIGTAYLLIFVCAITMIVAISTTARAGFGKKKPGQKVSRLTGARSLSFTEVVQCDLPVHARLALIQQHRARPSDRSSDCKQAAVLK